MRRHAATLGVLLFLFGIGAVTGYAVRPSPEEPDGVDLTEWQEPCLFYVSRYAQLLAAGGDADLRPTWSPEDEWYDRFRLDEKWLYLEKDNGKYGREPATDIALRWSTEDACATLRLEERP